MLELTSADMVVTYNLLAEKAGCKPLGKWSKKKQLLVDRIEALKDQIALNNPLADLPTDDTGVVVTEVYSEVEAPNDQDMPIEKTEPAEKQPDNLDAEAIEGAYGNLRQDTIKSTSINLLAHVDHYVDMMEPTQPIDPSHMNAKSSGIPYRVIVDIIKALHPGSKTSVACLRWYSVKIRNGEQGFEGIRLPWKRPRR